MGLSIGPETDVVLVDGNVRFFIEGGFLVLINGDGVVVGMHRVVPVLLRLSAERFPFGLLLIFFAHELEEGVVADGGLGFSGDGLLSVVADGLFEESPQL